MREVNNALCQKNELIPGLSHSLFMPEVSLPEIERTSFLQLSKLSLHESYKVGAHVGAAGSSWRRLEAPK